MPGRWIHAGGPCPGRRGLRLWVPRGPPVRSWAVKLSPTAVMAHARSDEGRKQLRYAGVSLVFVPVGQILIQVLAATVFSGDENNFTWASITAAAILTLPNFFANKYLVWKATSKDNLRTQVLVFWVAAMLGVTFATLLTFFVEGQVHDKVAGWVEALCVFAAQLVGFGIVWIGRYLILDRWLFKVTHHGEEPDEDDLDMLHGDLPV
jgi:putative flippase GtrA